MVMTNLGMIPFVGVLEWGALLTGLDVYAAFAGDKLIGQTWKSFLKMFCLLQK